MYKTTLNSGTVLQVAVSVRLFLLTNTRKWKQTTINYFARDHGLINYRKLHQTQSFHNFQLHIFTIYSKILFQTNNIEKYTSGK